MTLVSTEKVLVVPTELFHELGYFQGFSKDVDRYLNRLFNPEQTSYRLRSETEEDPSFKQLIPYVIFRYTDPSGEVSLFNYTRGKGMGEQRLHSKCSVGVGGHISSIDGEGPTKNPYEEGMRRELAEEVDIQTPYLQQIAGLINDDETEVGRVHLGVVHLFDVDRPAVFPREEDILKSGFTTISELLTQLDTMESWSRICVEALFGAR